MREALFIETNKEKWLQIEDKLINKQFGHPDELASDYIELTNDLAYAQTFYPGSKTKEYLNGLAVFAHQSVYKDQKSSGNEIVRTFKYRVPEAVYRNRKQILHSFLITLLATLIGWISAHYDDSFVRLILGDSYVGQTIENIIAGNPAAIYSSGSEIGGFFAITINNVRVAFMAFALGVFLSVGTGYVLFSNGIMLGAFHYIFYKYGVLGTAMSAIWIHGAFEISMIVIAGGCGLIVGNSILFPGSYTRLESFKIKIKDAATILFSTIPFFIIAGFLESFVTRHYDFSVVVSLLIILVSFVIVILYYYFVPKHLSKKQIWDS